MYEFDVFEIQQLIVKKRYEIFLKKYFAVKKIKCIFAAEIK